MKMLKNILIILTVLTAQSASAYLSTPASGGGGGGVWGSITGTYSSQVDAFDAGGFIQSGSVGSPNVITSAGGITSTANKKSTIYVVSNGGAITISANPQITAGSEGKVIKVVGTSDTNYITLQDGNGLFLNGVIVLKSNAVIDLYWNGSVWVESTRNN